MGVGVFLWARCPCRLVPWPYEGTCRGTSSMRKHDPTVGLCSGSYDCPGGGGHFLVNEVPLYRTAWRTTFLV